MESVPNAKVGVFHVEHTPVDEPAPADGTLFNELVNARIDRLYGERCTQLGERCDRLACKARLNFAVPGFDANDDLAPVAGNAAHDARLLLTMANRRL